ncbi:MAG: hypothetical protein J6B65_05915 [Paludibacteraceae bacterium]|nr:hypothetical protein [Paludibacteraceae bacterium]MBP3562739.1 hypothetical protein [Treponema sp.]
MKKLFALFIFVFIFDHISFAQKQENLYFLYRQKQINITFDYTWFEIHGVSDTTKKDMIEAFSNIWNDCFIKDLNEELEDTDVTIGNFPDANYTIFVQIISFNSVGKMKTIVNIIDTETLDEKCTFTVYGQGGLVGISHPNLIKDGMEHCGENLGEIIEDVFDLDL